MIVSEIKKIGGPRSLFQRQSAWEPSDFEKLARVNQHCLQGFQLIISKMNRRRRTIPVIESVALIVQNLANVFTKLNPSRGILASHAGVFRLVTRSSPRTHDKPQNVCVGGQRHFKPPHISEQLKRTTEFAKKSNFLSKDFLHFVAKRRKSVGKRIHQKMNRGNLTSRSLNPGKALQIAIFILSLRGIVSFGTAPTWTNSASLLKNLCQSELLLILCVYHIWLKTIWIVSLTCK